MKSAMALLALAALKLWKSEVYSSRLWKLVDAIETI